MVWGIKDKAEPVRVEDAFPAIITKREFLRAKKLLGSRAPKKVNPRRASSPYLIAFAADELEGKLGEVAVRLPEDVLQRMIEAGGERWTTMVTSTTSVSKPSGDRATK